MSLSGMSFSASIIIIVVIVLRALLIHKLPKKVFLVLWSVALLRLLVPFSFSSDFSIYSLISRNSSIMDKIADTSAVSVLPLGFHGQNEYKVSVDRKEEGEGLVNSAQKSDRRNSILPFFGCSFVSVWTIVWVVGACICTVVFLTAYISCYRRFCTSLPIKNAVLEEWFLSHKTGRKISVRQSDCIFAPLAYGFFCPVILMPKTTNWEDREQIAYILEHEFIHIRRFDAVAKLLFAAAVCIHWFNPLVWVMYFLANRDIELSCDEAVVRHFGEHSKSAYARALICMEEAKSRSMPFGSYFSKNAVEERIIAIMKLHGFSVSVYILAVVLVVSVTVAFATSAVRIQEEVRTDIYSGGVSGIDIETQLSKKQTKELFKEYQKYGVFLQDNILYYQNKPVRCLIDKYQEETTTAAGGKNINTIRVYTYFNENGKTDVSVVREHKKGKTEVTELYHDVKGMTDMTPVMLSDIAIDLPQKSRNKLAKKAANERKYGTLEKVAPFADTEIMDEIAENMAKNGVKIDEVITFISNGMADKLAVSGYQKWGFPFVEEILPFLSREALENLADTAIENGNLNELEEIKIFYNEKLL